MRAARTECPVNELSMAENLAFLDVDTQVDFMCATGSLYVPSAEQIIPNLKRLVGYALEQRIPVLSSADAHSPDDPSFAKWPPHCVIGTPGQQRTPETQLPSAIIVPNRPGAFDPPAEWSGQFVIEKQEYDVSTNVNFDAILGSLGPRRFVVFGVATEYCVLWSALALRKRDLPMDLVTDAIRAITQEGGRKAIEQMIAAGVRMVTTADVCV